MSKISLIIKREYLTRVKKKTFIIMTIVGPILMAALMIVPAWISQLDNQEEKRIAIIDQTNAVSRAITNTQFLKFENVENQTLDDIRKDFKNSGYYAVLFIPQNLATAPGGVQLFSNKQPNLGIKMHISNALEKELENEKLKAKGIDEDVIKAVKTNVSISTYKWTDEGVEETSTPLSMVVGYVSGFLIYLFIFLYGAQVMRGVIEEKTNRIIEVIVSSVRPFQLMMGKIVGVAMVGLTQFLLWVILTFVIVSIVQTAFFDIDPATIQQEVVAQDFFTGDSSSQLDVAQPVMDEDMSEIKGMLSSISQINFFLILSLFLFYFLGGYLLYSSLFAAIGAAVDNEADTQQFMLPISAPLIIAFIVGQNVINNPDGAVSFWFSLIPFTSPIVMMIRIPFGVPEWQVALSIGLLILSFIGTTWLAGKIYRTGILMYGKKISYKELWKWLKYSS